jgi:hypothetical protein
MHQGRDKLFSNLFHTVYTKGNQDDIVQGMLYIESHEAVLGATVTNEGLTE